MSAPAHKFKVADIVSLIAHGMLQPTAYRSFQSLAAFGRREIDLAENVGQTFFIWNGCIADMGI